jgi:hypothetical protein
MILPPHAWFDIYMFRFICKLPLYRSSFLFLLDMQNNLSFYRFLHTVAFLITITIATAINATEPIHFSCLNRVYK